MSLRRERGRRRGRIRAAGCLLALVGVLGGLAGPGGVAGAVEGPPGKYGPLQLQNVRTGLSVAVESGDMVVGKAIRQEPYKRDTEQEWWFEPGGEGYRIKSNVNGAYCLGRSADGVSTELLVCEGERTDWVFDEIGAEMYRVKVPGQNAYLASPGTDHQAHLVVGGSADDSTAWYFTSTSLVKAAPPADPRLDQATFLTTHNAWNNYEDMFLFATNQSRSIKRQLSEGVRGLMLDVTTVDNEVVLCHGGNCLTGSTGPDDPTGTLPWKFRDLMTRVVGFMNEPVAAGTEPIVTIFLEDYVAERALLDQAINQVAGLRELIFDPAQQGVKANGWPTLSAMRTANKRLLLFSDKDVTPAGGVAYGRTWTVENYWSIGDLGNKWECYSRWGERPLTTTASPGANFVPLFVMNQFRNVPTILTAAIDNGGKLLERARDYCGPAARKTPNYVAVDFYELPLGGSTHRAVEEINSYRYVPGPPAPREPAPAVPAGWQAIGTTATNKAYSFLRSRMNEYPAPVSHGLPRSYRGGYFSPGTQFGENGFESSFVYDDALMVIALVKSGYEPDVGRARTLGDALLEAQERDPLADGRLRASYLPNPFITASGTPYIGGFSTYTGNMAWVGMAWSQLYRATGDQRYLDGALRAANWIQANTVDDRGAGGYTGGYLWNDSGALIRQLTWKATEHNIDVGAFFAMLAQLTGNADWSERSGRAFDFVASMQADDGRLWTGTTEDGVHRADEVVPADIQAWSYLATLSPDHSRALDWALANHTAQDGPYQGMAFSSADRTKVWFEGTAQVLTALNLRGRASDAPTVAAFVDSLERAQREAPNHDGYGLVAASRDGLDTGMGDLYYASLHTGATAWFLLAARNANPFRL
ncbi:RICIN domain-containing protein [Kitasatospora griseola]|uniref:RICIN domain-containing protein n=1 Tax=Kitasatospora griseola TaxID=2064 RepID=UPI0038144D3E